MISSCAYSMQELKLDKTVIFVYYSSKIIVLDVINCRVFPLLNSWWWEVACKDWLAYTTPWQLRFLYRIYFLKRTLTNSNHVSLLETIRNVWLRPFYRTSNSQKGNQRWNKKMKTQRISCPLWHVQYHPRVPNLKVL